MTEAWRRRGLYLAGAWNLVGGITALADPARHFAQLYGTALSLADPLQAFFYRATWINVLAWGVGYVLAARHRSGRTPILLAGGLGKVAYFAACVGLVGGRPLRRVLPGRPVVAAPGSARPGRPGRLSRAPDRGQLTSPA